VIITYKAIDWWRTQHPGAVLSIRTGGGRMDPAIEDVQREVESLRRHAHA